MLSWFPYLRYESILAKAALTIYVRAALAVFLFTCEVVARWIEYWVLKASIRVRSCTLEFAAIVIDRRVCRQKISWLEESTLHRELAYLDHLQLNLVVPVFGAAADSLYDCVNKQTRSFSVKCGRLLAIFILAVVGAVSVEELGGE
jgi:hypothetical protein